MQKLTRITLNTGEMAIYLDGWYLTSTEPGDRADGLDDIVNGLLRIPGMTLQDTDAPCPAHEDWCWNDVADGVFVARQHDAGECTVAAFIDRLTARLCGGHGTNGCPFIHRSRTCPDSCRATACS